MSLPEIRPKEHRRLLQIFTLLPVVLAILVSLIGTVTLIGWQTGIVVLAGGVAGLSPTQPLPAICFVIAGIGLALAQRRVRWTVMLSQLLALVVAILGLVVLAEYAVGGPSRIDSLIFSRFLTGTASEESHRTAINTALTFVFFALGLLFVERDRRTKGLRSQLFATLLVLVAFVALVGYAFGVRDFYAFQVLSGMALYTAITFVLLGTGLLFSQLERGLPALVVDEGAAGFVSRRLFPGAIIVPFALTMLGVAAEQNALLGRDLGTSLVVVAGIVIFLLLIAWSARVVRHVDRKRGELHVLERNAREASDHARAEAEIAMTQAEAARAEAERANGAKSDFLAVMSHELRTPLAAIMGYQELLADGITGPITEPQAQQLGRIKASARHLLSLIDEILTFTRLDAGRETVTVESLDLEAAMHDAVELIEQPAKGKHLEIQVVSPGKGFIVETDAVKVRQILVNLLSNAVKFTDQGRVTLTGEVHGDHFSLKVKDTGIGIPPDQIHRIFEPFWQVEQKATRRASGTGLGLTVTRRLANILGGDVTVESTPGAGTTFSVFLPVKAPQIGAIRTRATRLRAG